jgi:Sulfotransferase domain
MGKILWLASYPKSGNTWIRAFLHNLMRNPEETFDINRMGELTAGDSQIVWYKMFDKRPWQEWSGMDVMKMRRQVQLAMMASKTDTVMIKTHNALLEIGGIPFINIDLTAGAIYVVRNPLDVCLSLADHYAVDIDKAIALMDTRDNGGLQTEFNVPELHSTWSLHVGSWTGRPHPALHIVRYEDMQAKPVATFGGIAAFLGLKPPMDRVKKAIALSSFDNLRKAEEKTGFRERSLLAERFFRVGKSGQWRDKLSQAQVDRIIAAHKEQMQRFGYWPL